MNTDRMATYKTPTVIDIPKKLKYISIEHPDPISPLGAWRIGEMPFLNFAPAFLSAVQNATRIWFNSLPLTEEFTLKGLGVIN